MGISDYDSVLQDVIGAIRTAIAEDWIMDYEIQGDTRLSDDLELESIEFVSIAEELRNRFGQQIDFVSWLANKDIHDLIRLTPDDLTHYVLESC